MRPEPSPGAPHPRGRLLFVDAGRSLAVGVALAAHAGLAFRVWGKDTATPARYLLQAAPQFIFMFGMMLEVVYAPRLAHGPVGPVARRLAARSLQCYVGYAATALAALLAGDLTLAQAGRALLLVQQVPYSAILVFYVFALLGAVPLLLLRRRWGLRGLLGLLVVVWSLHPVLAAVDGGRGWWWLPLGALVGVAWTPFGPSVLFGSTFIVAGMIVAEPLRGRDEAGIARFRRRAAGLAIAAAGVLAAAVAWEGPARVARVLGNYAHYLRVYRRGEHPLYFAGGVLLALAWLALLERAVPRGRPLPAWARVVLEFGRSSLLAFSLGNVLLILRPHATIPAAGSSRVGAVIVFLALLLGLLHAIAALRRRYALAAAGPPREPRGLTGTGAAR